MMDFRGASWVGDIYQKFEAMYLEVEETICEDAVKFVENQVQNVGSNMKKFYTDVMQDLASPDSTAPVKLPAADLPPDSYADSKTDENIKSGNKEDTKKVGNLFTDDLKVIDQEDGDQVSSLDEDTTVSCKKVPKKDCCQKETSPNQVSDYQVSDNEDGASLVPEIINECATPEHMALASSQVSVEVVGWEWDSMEEEKEMSSCEGIGLGDSTVNGPKSTDVLSSRTVGEGLAEGSIETNFAVKSNALVDSKTCQLTDELVALSDIEKAQASQRTSSNEELTGKQHAVKKVVSKTNNDNMDLEGETTNEDKIKLEEGCVIVNEKNISFSSYKDAKPWSYKKKIREALSLKKKSSRRQEYKKLVTQYENANTSSSLACVDTVPHTGFPQSNTAELQTREFCESDWELL